MRQLKGEKLEKVCRLFTTHGEQYADAKAK